MFVDRKIRFRLSPKSGVALKILRNQLSTLLSVQLRGDPLILSQLQWYELAMMVLGKIKPKNPDENQENITVVVNR